MILDQLVLKNVGTFAGRNSLELTPASTTKPIVLVGGLNGAGKTTILEAIHLALYGNLAQSTGRRSGGYDAYLRGLVHRGAPKGSLAGVELLFHANQQGAEHQYRVSRTWTTTGSSIRERLEVERNGVFDKALTSTWSEHVETFLPRGIAGLFFFDGEQIEALADLEKSREVLGSALSTLLGLDLVDRLTGDLAVLRRRHQMNQVPDALKEKVAEKREQATNVRRVEESTVEALALAQTELDRAEKLLAEASEQYRSHGGDLLEKRHATESAISTQRGFLDQIDAELRNEAADVAPLLQVRELLGRMKQRVDAEANAAEQRAVVDTLSKRDSALLQLLSSIESSASIREKVESFMSTDLDARRADSSLPNTTGLYDSSGLSTLLDTALPSVERRITTLLERRVDARAELDQLERVLVAMPHPESVANVKSKVDDALGNVARKKATLSMVQSTLTAARAERNKADAAYETELDRLAHAELSASDDTRIVTHVDRVRETLIALRSAASQRYVGRIGELVLEALQRLLRKQSLVHSVTIDPDSHSVELFGRDGVQLPAHQMSAGERQLLAVSLLWGLARASGQPLPVVIDTPLGRLDGSHRGHLIDRYFPHASHQVILLSTDTEIDEQAYRRLEPAIGRSYRLDFDQTTNSTAVLDGYFWS